MLLVKPVLRWTLVTLAISALGWGLWAPDPLGLRGRAELARALSYRGRVAVLGSALPFGFSAEGANLVSAASLPELWRALHGRDPAALVGALARSSVQGLLLLEPTTHAVRGDRLVAQLARYGHVAGLRGLYLSRAAALYTADSVQELTLSQRYALAVVARALLGGARAPKASSFPEPLRRLHPVEVMVLLREGKQARLWRSARGTSIASALCTAAIVARQRWQEREQALGGPLLSRLLRMDVEIALLEDDGTVADRDSGFVDRVFFAVHGVGYERKGAWRYLLPDATQEEGQGHASRAYRKLFGEDGLPENSFERHELRLYRLVLQKLSVSTATPAPDDALSPLRSPDELLGSRPHPPP